MPFTLENPPAQDQIVIVAGMHSVHFGSLARVVSYDRGRAALDVDGTSVWFYITEIDDEHAMSDMARGPRWFESRGTDRWA